MAFVFQTARSLVRRPLAWQFPHGSQISIPVARFATASCDALWNWRAPRRMMHAPVYQFSGSHLTTDLATIAPGRNSKP